MTLADPTAIGGAMALTAAATWAVSTVVYKGAIARFGPRAMNLFRCTVALVLFWITTLLVHGRAFFGTFATWDGAVLLASGMLGLGVGDHFLFHSMKKIGAQPAIALNQLTPIWSALIGVALASEALAWRQYGAMAIVIAGVLLVILGRVDLEHVDEAARRAAGRERALGVLAGCLSSLCNASAGVMTKYAVVRVGALPASALRMTGSAALLVGSVLVTGGGSAAILPLRTIAARGKEIAAVFLATFVGIFLQQAALERTSASVALCLLSTTPIFLLPLAIVVLRERYRTIAVVGTVLALAGIPPLVLGGGDARKDAPGTGGVDVPRDPHSFARPEEAVVRQLDLDLRVDFERKTLSGRASARVEAKAGAREVVLDTRDLSIERVTTSSACPSPGARAVESDAKFALGEERSGLGRSLTVPWTAATGPWINVYYATSPGAAALQWLDPEQTSGGKRPFLFTQSQAILARTWVPCQDSPGVRSSYHARVAVPPDLLAVMSASNPQSRAADGRYEFEMPLAIPSYLLALAVGDLEFRPLGERCGVYAEPRVVGQAADEFVDLAKMIAAAESLYGPYRWGRYDVIVLPPSFPFGGMENPRLTFATPTILAGDRSLVSLVAHELAHSWSGNLVTNATWNDFWLNEGFTVYFEHRIMEKVFGDEFERTLAVLGLQDLEGTLAELESAGKARDTWLELDLAGRDPDDGVNDVAYEKGARFLRVIEREVGRPRFDAFLRRWFDRNAFQSRTTSDFLEFLRSELVKGDAALEQRLQIEAWVHGPGLPSNCPRVESSMLAKAQRELDRFVAGAHAASLDTNGFTTQQWQHLLRKLPATTTAAQMQDLDATFGLSARGNSEVLFDWLKQSIAHRFEPAFPALERFLTSQGRRKFLKPLYADLMKSDWGRPLARRIYAKARPSYHAVSRDTIDEIVTREE